jgi:hypothetical protein
MGVRSFIYRVCLQCKSYMLDQVLLEHRYVNGLNFTREKMDVPSKLSEISEGLTAGVLIK